MRSPLILSRDELARRWHRKPSRIKSWTEAGLIPHFTDPESGRVMYPLAAIEAFERDPGNRQKAS